MTIRGIYMLRHSDLKQAAKEGLISKNPTNISVLSRKGAEKLTPENGYMAYMTQRPQAEKLGDHGPFSTVDQVDLKKFLLRSGERLLPSDREKRMASDYSATICGSG